MSRPTKTAMDVTVAGWVTTLNSNFQKLFDAPFPILQVADMTALNTKNPGLYANCLAVVQTNHRIYRSNGTAWVLYESVLTHIAALNPATCSLTDIKNAFNSLMTDMRSKNLMAAS